MKKLLSLPLVALMTILSVSCDKKDPNNNGNGNGNQEEPEVVVNDVMTDLVIGDKTFPIKTFNARHAIAIAGYEEDYIRYSEDDISSIGIPGASQGIFPVCFPLGDRSLQEAYDEALLRKPYCVFIVTDKELKAEDCTFLDEVPVGILPESALETIRGSLETGIGTTCFEAGFHRRDDLFSPGGSLKGKQWLYTSVYSGTVFVVDYGFTNSDKVIICVLYDDNNYYQGWYDFGNGYEFHQVDLPDEVSYDYQWNYDIYDESASGFTIRPGKSYIFKILASLGDYVLVNREEYDPHGNFVELIPFVFSPVPKPVTMKYIDKCTMRVSAGGENFPVWLSPDCEDVHRSAFLDMGADVPFVYLDAYGTQSDFNGRDVNGKIVGIKRGGISFAEKQTNALNAGAIGVLCINTSDDTTIPGSIAELLPFGIVPLRADEKLKSATTVSFLDADGTAPPAKAPEIVLSQTSTEVGCSLEIIEYVYYSINHPVAGETLIATSTDEWINIQEISPEWVKYMVTRSGPEDLNGAISLSYPGAEPKTFTVKQHSWNNPYTTLSVSQPAFDIPNTAGTYTFAYTITHPIELAPLPGQPEPLTVSEQYDGSTAGWLSSKLNENEGTVSFTATENPRTSIRKGSIVVKYAGAKVAYVAVNQGGRPAGPTEIDLNGMEDHNNAVNAGGEEACFFYASVKNPISGTNLVMEADAAWITNIRKKGTTEGEYCFTASRNTTGKTRNGHIVFTYGALQKKLKFHQDPDEVAVILTPGDLTFNYEARPVSFSVNLPDGANYSNLSVSPEDQYTFIKNLAVNGNKVSFDLSENNSGGTRGARIKVTYAGKTSIFTLTQTFDAPVFTVSPSALTLGYQKQARNIDIQIENPRNLSLTVIEETDTPWLRSYSLDGVAYIAVENNSTGASRTTTVIIRYGDASLGSGRLLVTQTTSSTSISIEPSILPCNNKGTTAMVPITIQDPLPGIEVQAVAAASWLSVDLVSEAQAKVTVLRNPKTVARSSNVTFRYGSFSAVLNVTQDANVVPDGFVDLGLPSGTLWAQKNMGAAVEYDYGTYYAWDDAMNAVSQANTAWSLPTWDQLDELLHKCDWVWVLSPVAGMKVGSKEVGTEIFLPAAGFMGNYGLTNDTEVGYYWSQTPFGTWKTTLMFNEEGGPDISAEELLTTGMPVRPVCMNN